MQRSFFHISLLLLFCSHLFWGSLAAQELDCQVNVSASQVQSSDRDKFKELQKAVDDFMNNRKWTNQDFGVEERIDCSILINISNEVASDKYKASIRVQSRRPVYNTSYNSTIFNYKDDNLTFEYTKYENLDFDLNSFQSNLSSVLAFYAYLIIGLDFDSFSPLGGTPYLQNAQTIVNNAQNSDAEGWKSFESRNNRYWITEDLLNGSLSMMRQGIYQYHRKGLDQMAEEMEKGRKEILEALEKFKQAKNQKSFLHILDVLMNAKKDELIHIFEKASSTNKPKAVELLKETDPAHSSDYDKILQQ
ncbi:MAG: DUF4835 family protein [Bacteroidales bacterium]